MVAEGLARAGADYILVCDGHGPMRNLFFEDMHPAAHLLTGSGDAKDHCQLEGADSRAFEAAVLIGYHAMAKSYNAIHPHTTAGAAVAELRVNGIPHSETGLNAAVLGSLGIPVIMVTGDATTMDEARLQLGGIGHVGIVLAELARTGRALAGEEADRPRDDTHAVHGIPRDMDKVSGAGHGDLVAEHESGSARQEIDELLVVRVVMRRRPLALVIGDDTDFH